MSKQRLPEPWLPMESAPKDGQLVRLLVQFEENAIDDGDEPFATIGQNNFQNDRVDRWQFVGWNWTHDEFTDGLGTPLGWLPMLDEQSTAARDVLAERQRQITTEGWTQAHDDLYSAAELPRAAAAYILNGANDDAPCIWPFASKWWKPKDARTNYVRAGALILAEIERIDRLQSGSPEERPQTLPNDMLLRINEHMNGGRCPTTGSLGECAYIGATPSGGFEAALYLWDDSFDDSAAVAKWFRNMGAEGITVSLTHYSDWNDDRNGAAPDGARQWIVSFSMRETSPQQSGSPEGLNQQAGDAKE